MFLSCNQTCLSSAPYFKQFSWVFNQEVLEGVGNFLRNSACTCRKPCAGLLRQWPSGLVGQGRFFLRPASLSHCDFVHVVFLLAGWEGVWNRRSCVGKDQGFLLVACHGGVLEGHLQAAGNVWHAVGPVVWWWQVLRGESRMRWALLNGLMDRARVSFPYFYSCLLSVMDVAQWLRVSRGSYRPRALIHGDLASSLFLCGRVTSIGSEG